MLNECTIRVLASRAFYNVEISGVQPVPKSASVKGETASFLIKECLLGIVPSGFRWEGGRGQLLLLPQMARVCLHVLPCHPARPWGGSAFPSNHCPLCPGADLCACGVIKPPGDEQPEGSTALLHSAGYVPHGGPEAWVLRGELRTGGDQQHPDTSLPCSLLLA